MPARVVDVLELIEIDKTQRAASAVLSTRFKLGIELRNQPVPAIQTRNQVMVRNMQQVLFAFLQCGERVSESTHDGLSFFITRDGKRHFHRTLGDLRERLL